MDVTCEKAGAELSTGKKANFHKHLSDSYTTPLPTIRENSPVVRDSVEHSPSHSLYTSEVSLENCMRYKSAYLASEDMDVRCLPKISRSVSFGFHRQRPKISIHDKQRRLSSSLPEAPISSDMMELLLPVINIEQYKEDERICERPKSRAKKQA
ncbi:hypothetical protein SK128_025647 [Halocaridina rubra]|uniref:Uncharacterized protein n=1 Tax=Halocaridina rubra TaxID=373956 RepID=A0AAN8WB36_HALRR